MVIFLQRVTIVLVIADIREADNRGISVGSQFFWYLPSAYFPVFAKNIITKSFPSCFPPKKPVFANHEIFLFSNNLETTVQLL